MNWSAQPIIQWSDATVTVLWKSHCLQIKHRTLLTAGTFALPQPIHKLNHTSETSLQTKERTMSCSSTLSTTKASSSSSSREPNWKIIPGISKRQHNLSGQKIQISEAGSLESRRRCYIKRHNTAMKIIVQSWMKKRPREWQWRTWVDNIKRWT